MLERPDHQRLQPKSATLQPKLSAFNRTAKAENRHGYLKNMRCPTTGLEQGLIVLNMRARSKMLGYTLSCIINMGFQKGTLFPILQTPKAKRVGFHKEFGLMYWKLQRLMGSSLS